MMNVWATVVSWQRGVALLRCETSPNCGSCHSRGSCASLALNRLSAINEHQLEILIDQPLKSGQRVEVGIAEGSLVRSALVVYLTPLLGLIFAGVLFEWLFFNDYFTAIGALVGGAGGVILARIIASKLDKKVNYQIVVLKIGPAPIISMDIWKN